jgi:2-hydroxy-3-keto-5-methylthiopentenyl-1-phosphate phosphatase
VEFALSVAEPREGLMELLDWAHWNDWQAAVVSNGWDLYIDPILAKLGADRVLRHCGRTRFAYQWQLRYFSPRGVELADGFKVSYIASYREHGDYVAFVGDGPSDVTPARLAHTVFARDILWDELRHEHSRVREFETFHDVRVVLEQESPEWLASFSSTTAAGG